MLLPPIDATERTHRTPATTGGCRGQIVTRRRRPLLPVDSQRLVVHGDRLLQRHEVRARSQAELVEDAASALERPQGLGLASGALQRGHQQQPPPLPQRLVGDERFQCADNGRRPAGRHDGASELFLGDTAELPESDGERPCRLPLLEIAERATTPQPQCNLEGLRRPGGFGQRQIGGCDDQLLEATPVERVGPNLEAVARGACAGATRGSAAE